MTTVPDAVPMVLHAGETLLCRKCRCFVPADEATRHQHGGDSLIAVDVWDSPA